MKKLLIFSLFGLSLLFGCGGETHHERRIREAKEYNTKSLESGGELIGKLPDGRELKRLYIRTDWGSGHVIYFLGDVTTTNSYSSDKHRTLKVEALIEK